MKKDSFFVSFVLPLIIFVGFIAFWQFGGVHAVLQLKPYQLPTPSKIVEALQENYVVIIKHSKATLIEALVGLCIGSFLGFVIAVVAVVVKDWGYGGLTLASAFNAIPIIALAPVMNNWFGMGMGSKIAVVSVFTMATMAINAYRGFTIVKPFSEDLMRSNAASETEIFYKLRLPNAIPNIMTALKIGTTSSMIAAICSEFFSSYEGIGYQLSTALKMGQMPMAWSYICVAAVLGIIMYAVVTLLERCAIPWHTSQR